MFEFILLFVVHCASFFSSYAWLGGDAQGERARSARAREKNILVNFQFGDGDEHVSKIPVFTGKSRGRQRRQRKGM